MNRQELPNLLAAVEKLNPNHHNRRIIGIYSNESGFWIMVTTFKSLTAAQSPGFLHSGSGSPRPDSRPSASEAGAFHAGGPGKRSANGLWPRLLARGYSRLQQVRIWALDDLCWSRLWGWGTVIFQLYGFCCQWESNGSSHQRVVDFM